MGLFTLDLSVLGIEEKLRPMVIDVIKVSTVAVVMEVISLNLAGQSLDQLLNPVFLNRVLFQALGFIFFYMVVYEAVDIKLKNNSNRQ